MDNSTDDALHRTAQFWREYYARSQSLPAPSPFASWCLETHLPAGSTMIEFGCGNGRDSFAFMQAGHHVIALDGCEVAIARNQERYEELRPQGRGRFIAQNFAELGTVDYTDMRDTNIAYSRFVLHAIPEALEEALLDYCWRILPSGGRMLHEFRTTRDPLSQKGEALSNNERLTDHYRRFINTDHFRRKLVAKGWKETFFTESNGLAVYGEEDPVVARIIAQKP